MSPITGYLTCEARATIDAVLAKLAAPGMCNPADAAPCVSGTPSQQAIEHDTRSAGQRNHDALTAAGRALLASGDLGQHNGLPASIIVSTTLQELEAATGRGLTGGGTLLPMSDVIRLASHAHHYLVVFDKHTNRTQYLAHSKRIANADQRIVLHAKDGGCTRPGCTVAGCLSEVHHVNGWAGTRTTHIDDLTLACPPDNTLAEQGWTTRKRHDGTTEWIPPPHLDFGKPRTNGYWHPERYLHHSAPEDHDNDNP
jgi:Domain of unknown function (DUF222)